MNITLTQKERFLLEDQKSHEELCIKKYTDAANQAQDPQLKQIFQNHAQAEQQHLNTVNQLLSGTIPNMNQQQGQQGQQNQQQNQQGNQSGNQAQASGSFNQKDKELCQDLLTTEKYVSGTYDTTIFEFTNTDVRQLLNHIQKEEQQHGEDIFLYMQSTGMYKPQ
ncbi:spore coat protein [Alkaliphilus transvaalensis]|uniref:spore coat protein n=1 Tax=Alkaliphilus transvaalensis TaxID=114628 RepID=UPI000479364E|nr:spore coat protein [Alkaliphilus transvaalensis]